jgi:hypothetical protein
LENRLKNPVGYNGGIIIKIPPMEDFAAQFLKAAEDFVKEIGEIAERLIQKLKDFFGGLM